jgi:hypothetical protein
MAKSDEKQWRKAAIMKYHENRRINKHLSENNGGGGQWLAAMAAAWRQLAAVAKKWQLAAKAKYRKRNGRRMA